MSPAGLLTALFCSLFLGREYHDGTIRNRIMAGYRRRDIYLANQRTCMLVLLVMVTVYILTACLLALPVLEWGYVYSYSEEIQIGYREFLRINFSAPDLAETILLVFTSFFTTAVYCSLCTFLAMLHSERSFSVISCFSVIYLFNHVGGWIADYANGTKTILRLNGTTTWLEGDGAHILDRMPEGLIHFLADFMPGAQAERIFGRQYEHMLHIMVCSVILILLLTTLGIYLFDRKNIN